MATHGDGGSDPLLRTLLDIRTIFDPDSALTSTLHLALDAVGERSAVAWVALPEPDGGLVIERVLGQRTPALDRLDVGSGKGLTGKVFARARADWVDEYVAASSITHEFDAIIQAEHIRRMIAAPLKVDDAMMGVLTVARRDFGEFGDQTIAGVVDLARRASQALAIAQEARSHAAAAALAERRRISEEIHDGIGALLFSMASRTERLQRQSAHTHLSEQIDDLQRELGEVGSMVRSLVSGWHATASSDLRAEIQGVVGDFERRSGIEAVPVFLGSVPEVDGARMQAVTRFVGVALSNVERHADARRVSVTLSGLPDQLTVAISNDGPAPGHVVPGVGLGGAEERIARLGGTLAHFDDDGDGFTVRARIPLR